MTERINSAAADSGGPPPAQEKTRAHLPRPAMTAALWERLKETNIARLTALEIAATAVLEDALDDHLRRKAEAEAHKLAGSLGSFGFVESSRVAREIEYLLQGAAPLQQAEALRFSELVVTLRRELERPPAGKSPAVPGAAASPRLLIISEDEDLTEWLAVEAAGRGMEAATAAGLSEGMTRLTSDCYDLVLLDLPRSAEAEAGRRFLADLMTRTPPVPALVLAGEDAFIDRVEVAGLGARAFLQKPVPASWVIEAAARVLQRLHPPGAGVLVVCDDPHPPADLRTLLEPQGLHTTILTDPLRFWDFLGEVSPDILVLDVEMSHARGIELLQVVRNDPRWAALAVLFLTAHTDPDTVRRIVASGADDLVAKPVTGPELVVRILNRLERTRVLRSMANSDELTGAASQRKFVEVATQFIRMADRRHEPVGFGVLNLDEFTRINLAYGHAAGDRVLRRVSGLLLGAFRREDVVSRGGGDEFLVAMYGMDRAGGVHRLAEVLERLRHEEFTAAGRGRFRATFSAGVVQYPDDGADLNALLHAAEEALSQAKTVGRDRVLAGGLPLERGQMADNPDVVVVEDDETTAGLLLHALQTRGYRTRWFRDGPTAADALGSPGGPDQARVVLLDVDLPGLDGISVLRRMARSGALSRTRVIMLTARASEAEVLGALELGAVDHVAKPFSLPVLMQRVRRALGT